MDYCEVCGLKPAVKRAIIEGVVLNVCSDCVGLGKVIEEKVKLPKKTAGGRPPRNEEIVDGYAQILQKRISSSGIKYEELAKKINESESYLRRVVRGETIPTITLARKLEKTLGVKIVEEEE
ncbi:MAG: helix-turn-helix domain-containing protein [Candidatus Micrarchaeia archaeon]